MGFPLNTFLPIWVIRPGTGTKSVSAPHRTLAWKKVTPLRQYFVQLSPSNLMQVLWTCSSALGCPFTPQHPISTTVTWVTWKEWEDCTQTSRSTQLKSYSNRWVFSLILSEFCLVNVRTLQLTGSPVYAKKRLQFNMPLEPNQKIDMFKNITPTVLPLFWIEEVS